jgi:hypothetical protein
LTTAAIKKGAVFHWKDYIFDDGQTANKYLVIVGCKTGCNYLAVIATSQSKRKEFKPGCNPSDGYYHIPGNGKDWFPKDTWLVLSDPKEISAAEFLKNSVARQLTHQTQLREEIANAIANCMKQCDDVSEYHLSLL